MRPLFLEFKGLNSFSEKAEIDFTPLLQGGIFGIFGETGSGKSTILDAINFALFGDIGRSAVKTDKINDKCDSLEVKFTFDIFSEGKRRKYYIERSIKRKSGTHKAMLYELGGTDSGICLADNVKSVDNKIVDIIGINEEDFKKCIALPQGEFSRFVKSAPSERTELIERLFSLQKYGENLKFKLSRYKMQKEGEYNTLAGKLSSYEDVTRDKIKELEQQTQALAQGEAELKKRAEDAATAYSAQKKLFEDSLAFVVASKKLEGLKAEKIYYDELGKLLPVLPYCVTAVERSEEIKMVEDRISSAVKARAENSAAAEKCKQSKAVLEEKINKSDYDGEYRKLSELYGQMNGLLPDANKLVKKAAELTECRKKYKQRQEELAKINKSLDEKQRQLFSLQSELNALPEPDIAEYFGSQIKEGILKDEYAKNLCYIKDLQDGVNFYADGSALYDYITKELKLKADEYKELILSLKDVKVDVYGQLQKFSDRLKKHRVADNAVNNCLAETELLKQNKDNAERVLLDTLAEGERVKAEYGELSQKLADVFGSCTDYKAETEKIYKKAEAVKQQQKKDEEELKKIENILAEYSAKDAAAEQACKSLEDRKKSAVSALKDCLEKSATNSAEDCAALVQKYGSYSDALQKYNKFIADYSAAENEVKRLGDKRADTVVSEETLKQSEEIKLNTQKEYSVALQIRAVKESETAGLKERLKQKKQIEKEIAALNAERDVISQLDKLIRDNKFMKYIANEYLENISHTASKTLIGLTDGRYFLKYEDNNFCVGDNYNGGNLRRVNTLSGGETFLVSLSLSLALSDTICRRSLKSIEFFFLDEGFGTLDGDLIDTVIDALEKLKSADFTIGIISHVEELKHRINNKILVSKATENHGSSVRISC
ncbi:MAG: SMC family ATPase [Clostridia bacterium]|nr:SMC family ATPase [Clostridia bacterium]